MAFPPGTICVRQVSLVSFHSLLDCKEIFDILQYEIVKGYNMPRKQTNSNRGDRIASKVQTLVAEILRDNYADDSLLSGVSLVGATSHGGLQFVKLFYYSRSNDTTAVQKKLDDATKTIRFELAARMNQKYVPEIKFVYDDTLDRAARIDELLNNLNN